MPAHPAAILKLRVPLIVRLAERPMRLAEVLALHPGAIIELPRDAEEPLELLVNNRPVGGGHAVKVGEKFGLRLEWIGEPSERIGALGGPESVERSGEEDEDAIARSLLSGPL